MQRGVVDEAHRPKLAIEEIGLFSVGIDANLRGFQHALLLTSLYKRIVAVPRNTATPAALSRCTAYIPAR
ncbi:hypothetical protein HHSLTHF2_12240 [Vreelandella venusta]|uniref:Uncharacterized protein n=1 Tax=Halomonas hydrothermalis TaxID=115561 RepID=A0A6F8U2B5_9GAMM|nr:hypothetical protein HHSLTHF2_12240 [Halomonas hydrothermalis]